MNYFTLILEKFKLRETGPVLGDYAITWQDSAETGYSIQIKDIACRGRDIAWLESSENDENFLVVYQNERRFIWKPKTYNDHFRCDCVLIEWIQDHLIFIYREEHDTYICSIKDGEVKAFEEIESWPMREAEKQGLVPQIIISESQIS